MNRQRIDFMAFPEAYFNGPSNHNYASPCSYLLQIDDRTDREMLWEDYSYYTIKMAQAISARRYILPDATKFTWRRIRDDSKFGLESL